MGDYDVMDEAIAGLKYGIDSRIEGGWACAESDGISFGMPVFGYIGDEEYAYNYHLDVGKIVFDADFVTLNEIVINVNGEDAATVTYATSHDNTMNLLVAAVSALDGVECVLDADDGDNRTLLIQVKGDDAVVTETVTLGGSQPTGTITYGSSQVYLGMSMFVQKSAATSDGEAMYDQFDAVNVIVEGWVYANSVGTCKANNEAYVYATAGDDFGKLSSAGEEIAARFRSNAISGALVRVFTDGQKEMAYAGLF